jgi:16S rRNA C967 or C1407 C5-methylase (RsmB/RsmF family)/NOL1/NOP2/fmu family ribosome biogenesis protein
MRPLPPEFVARMAPLLGDELDAFLAALAAPRVRGLRLNPAKTGAGELQAALVPPLTPVPWCPQGFTFDGVPLGGHPAHVAGLFYLQEPSAMLVAEALDPRPGDRVADLAAAPGGKTTHLAALVGPTGMVLANEFTAGRLSALHATLDLWGGPGVVTTSRPIEALAGAVEPFDGVVLDAPCSGEGLFRRRPAAVRDWSPGAVAGSARRQARLLAAAAQLVRPGGVLVYSTCTFNREENEDRASAFLADHPEWRVEAIGAAVSSGVDGPGGRIWPHRSAGEGQYVARLRAPDGPERPLRFKKPDQDPAVRAAWADFVRTSLTGPPPFDGDLVVRGDTIYLGPSRPGVEPRLLARPGLPLGRARPGRFEPAAALATSLTPAGAAQTVHFGDDDPALRAYLTGNTVESPGADGWVLVCWGRHPLGWGRRTGGVLKNALPEHARRMTT